MLQRQNRAKATGKLDGTDALIQQILAQLLIEQYIRPPELVNRLFRVADDEELAVHGPGFHPVAFARIAGYQQ